jgi:hypothetical protein
MKIDICDDGSDDNIDDKGVRRNRKGENDERMKN